MDFIENVGRRSKVKGDTSSIVHVGGQSLNGYEANALYRNAGGGRFVNHGYVAAVARTEDARGLGVSDFDNDGDLDLIISNYQRPATLLLNPGTPKNHWLQIELEGVTSNRDAVGARVVIRHDGRTQSRQVSTTRGYLSGQSSMLHFGLGTSDRIELLEVHWPSGLVERVPDVDVDRRVRLVEERARKDLAKTPAGQ